MALCSRCLHHLFFLGPFSHSTLLSFTMVLLPSLGGFEITTAEETLLSKIHFDKKHVDIFLLHTNLETLLLNLRFK